MRWESNSKTQQSDKPSCGLSGQLRTCSSDTPTATTVPALFFPMKARTLHCFGEEADEAGGVALCRGAQDLSLIVVPRVPLLLAVRLRFLQRKELARLQHVVSLQARR